MLKFQDGYGRILLNLGKTSSISGFTNVNVLRFGSVKWEGNSSIRISYCTYINDFGSTSIGVGVLTWVSVYLHGCGCTYIGVGVLVPVWVCQYQEVPVDFIHVLAHRTVDPVFSQ